MRQLLILLLTFLGVSVYGQKTGVDSTIKVVYADKVNRTIGPAFFINGKLAGNSLPVKPNDIDSISIVHGDFQFDSVKYQGQVHIFTKKDYSPKLISLTALKEKYTRLGSKTVVFTIDGTIVNADYNTYLVDENNLFQIFVDKISIDKNVDLGLIRLLTKSEHNNIKSNGIMLRGNEVTRN